jgi:hypothetical protein
VNGFLQIGEAIEVGEHHRCRGSLPGLVPTPRPGGLVRAGRRFPTHQWVRHSTHSDTARTAGDESGAGAQDGATNHATSGSRDETCAAAGHGATYHTAASASGGGTNNCGACRTVAAAACNDDAYAVASLASRAREVVDQ